MIVIAICFNYLRTKESPPGKTYGDKFFEPFFEFKRQLFFP